MLFRPVLLSSFLSGKFICKLRVYCSWNIQRTEVGGELNCSWNIQRIEVGSELNCSWNIQYKLPEDGPDGPKHLGANLGHFNANFNILYV